jgi:hypothetical protein
MIFTNPLPNYISNHTHDNIEIAIFFTIFWFCMLALIHFMVGKETHPKLPEVKNRLVSIVHGMLIFSIAFIDVFFHKCEVDQVTTNFQLNILLCSMGYVIYDCISCLCQGLFGYKLLIHHAVTLIGLGAGVFFKHGGTTVIYG